MLMLEIVEFPSLVDVRIFLRLNFLIGDKIESQDIYQAQEDLDSLSYLK